MDSSNMNPSGEPDTKYKAQAGDTLASIAAKSGITVQALEAANMDVANPNLIYPGKTINIPSDAASAAGGTFGQPVVVYENGQKAFGGASLNGEQSKSPEEVLSQPETKGKNSFFSKFKFF